MGFERSLPHGFEDFTPLDRVVITANGNLQRIISAYNNTPVKVTVLHNEQVQAGKYDRKVSISCGGLEFCVATTQLSVTDPGMLAAIESKQVGIGQLFRKYNLLPHFTLLKAQKNGDSFFRTYVLKAPGIECEICESFTRNLWTLGEESAAVVSSLPGLGRFSCDQNKGHFGDLMSQTNTSFSTYSDEFAPLERILLSVSASVHCIHW
jgi:hypothetical protein